MQRRRKLIDYGRLRQGSIASNITSKKWKIDIADLTLDIHRVIKQLNRRPTTDDYIKHGKYPISTLFRLFGKEWDEILATLGYKTAKNTYSYQEVVEELERVAKQLAKLPTLHEYNQIAKIDADIVKRVAKTNDWLEVLATVFNIRVELVEQVLNLNHVYYQEQLTKLKTISDKLKRVPSIAESIKYGIKVDLLMKRLNKKWVELLALAQINLAPRLAPEVAPSTSCLTHRSISKEQMLEDLNLIAHQLGYYPTELKYDLLGSYWANNLKYRLDKTWLGIIDLAKSHSFNILAERSMLSQKSCLNKTILEFFDIPSNKNKGIDLDKYRF